MDAVPETPAGNGADTTGQAPATPEQPTSVFASVMASTNMAPEATGLLVAPGAPASPQLPASQSIPPGFPSLATTNTAWATHTADAAASANTPPLSIGAIVGLSIGGLAVLLLGALFVFICIRLRRRDPVRISDPHLVDGAERAARIAAGQGSSTPSTTTTSRVAGSSAPRVDLDFETDYLEELVKKEGAPLHPGKNRAARASWISRTMSLASGRGRRAVPDDPPPLYDDVVPSMPSMPRRW